MKNNKGFTLIELLVVIAIIAVLATLALAGISGAQRQARDTQRRNDLNQYRLALESYSVANGSVYPVLAAPAVLVAASGVGSTLTTQNYMTNILTDPNSTGACAAASRQYCYVGTALNFVLYGGLEAGGGYWEICDITQGGKVGKVTALPADATCDLP